jgi:hypothetical protein
MDSTTKPRILFLYYSYTQQSLKVVEAMSEELRGRGFDVHQAAIEFTDQRYAKRLSKFPMPHPVVEVLGMLPVELRHATGEFRIPDEAFAGEYDLVVIGSPTWWLSTSVPVRSFLQSEDAEKILGGRRFTAFVVCRRYWKHNLKTVQKLGEEKGGTYLAGAHFAYLGGQVRSMLSLLSYFGSGEQRERFLGVKIPPTNLQPEHLEAARTFANELADKMGGSQER